MPEQRGNHPTSKQYGSSARTRNTQYFVSQHPVGLNIGDTCLRGRTDWDTRATPLEWHPSPPLPFSSDARYVRPGYTRQGLAPMYLYGDGIPTLSYRTGHHCESWDWVPTSLSTRVPFNEKKEDHNDVAPRPDWPRFTPFIARPGPFLSGWSLSSFLYPHLPHGVPPISSQHGDRLDSSGSKEQGDHG